MKDLKRECNFEELRLITEATGKQAADIEVPWNPERTLFVMKRSIQSNGKEFYKYMTEPYTKG